MIDRLPPQSIEAEQSILGSILIDRDAIIEVADFLKPEDFYRQAHGRIYSVMIDLSERREPVDRPPEEPPEVGEEHGLESDIAEEREVPIREPRRAERSEHVLERPADPGEVRIPLRPDMVANEAGWGGPGAIADEARSPRNIHAIPAVRRARVTPVTNAPHENDSRKTRPARKP